MSKIEFVIERLLEENLISDVTEFSTTWVERNSGWAAYTLHKKRDFNIPTAINVLRNTRKRIKFYEHQASRVGTIANDSLSALKEVENLLTNYLRNDCFIEGVTE